MTGPRACGSLPEKSKWAMPSGDGDGDGELQRLVHHHAVAVEQSLRGRRPLRQVGDGGAQLLGRAFEDGGEGLAHGGGAEPTAQLADADGAHLGHRDLRLDVAAHQRGLPAVGEDDALDVVLRRAGVDDLDRRQQQALVEHLGGVGRGRAGDRAADIGLVRDRARERDDLAVGEHRRHEGHVGDVRQPALVGVIGDEHVARRDRTGVDLEDAADQVAVDRSMEEHRRRHDQPAVAVEDHAAEVAQFADDGGIAGAIEMVVHLIDQARHFVAQDLDGDGVHGQSPVARLEPQRVAVRNPGTRPRFIMPAPG